MGVFGLTHKFPHTNDITFRLKRSSTFYYQGSPTFDANAIGNGNSGTYVLDFNNIELFLSKYIMTQKIIQEINEIKVMEDVMYKVRKVNTFSFQISNISGTFQQTVNSGAIPDAAFVSFLRQEALSSPTTTITTTLAEPQPNSKIYSFLGCAPRAISSISGADIPAGVYPPNSLSAYVTPLISSINVYYSGIQEPSIIYQPDVLPSTGEVIANNDREYEVFAQQVKEMGLGGCLTTITKEVWNTYYRVFAFNLTRNNDPSYVHCSELTNRTTVTINVNFAGVPPYTGNANAQLNTTQQFVMLVITICNQSILKVNADNSVVYIE